MKVEEAIHRRRSIFPDLFIDKEVADEDIQLLIDAANQSPSHKKTNPWRFKVVKNEALGRLGGFLASAYKEGVEKEKFSQFKYDKIQKKIRKSGAVIALCMQRDPKERVPEWEEIAATAMAVQNLWLRATGLGLGGYWSSPGTISEMHRFFNFDDGERCLGFFYLGHYDPALHPLKISKNIASAVWLKE